MTQEIKTIRIATQGPAGPAGLYPQGAWDAGSVPYVRSTVVSHSGCVWLALRDTSVEPSTDTPDDWALWLDFGGMSGSFATLGPDGKLDPAELPALTITDTFVVASQAEMLALTAQRGDLAIRSDLNKSFVLAADDASVLANWKELLTPLDAVLSVAGRTGAVALGQADISGLTTSDSPTFVGLTLTGRMASALTFATDNTYDIGSSPTAFRPKNVNIGGWFLSALGQVYLRNDSSSIRMGASDDLVIARDAANALGQRNGASAQALRVYGTYTSTTSFERLSLDAGFTSANVLRVMAEKGSGGGTLRPIAIDGFSKSGAMVAADIPAGSFALFKDTSGGGVVLGYNDGGTLKTVALT